MTDAAAAPGLTRALSLLAQGGEIDFELVRDAFDDVMAGRGSGAQIAGLLMALRVRGETAEVVAGTAAAMRRVMTPVVLPAGLEAIDTCGTGGGSMTTVNVSTAAAVVAAAAGAVVAKHGNRSFTSRSGSADVLEALGISTSLDARRAADAIAATGFGFLFAPNFHPAMRHVAPVRRELGIRTVMNLVGPLANPAGVRRQLLGVADRDRGRLMADSLARLGTARAMVVQAEQGMDEISPVGATRVWELREGEISEWRLDPADLGMEVSSLAGLEGGEPEENAARIAGLFASPASAAPALRSAVLLNAAAALYIAGDGDDLGRALGLARDALDGGAADARLQAIREAAPLRTS